MQGHFTSSIGVLLTMMGSVVGTGNIWRFPRILANNATEGGRLRYTEQCMHVVWCTHRQSSKHWLTAFINFAGALAFLLVWFAFLWLWSIPIILIENGIGRFTKKSTVESFNKLLGPSYRFMGGFQAFAALSIGWETWLPCSCSVILVLQFYQIPSITSVNNNSIAMWLSASKHILTNIWLSHMQELLQCDCWLDFILFDSKLCSFSAHRSASIQLHLEWTPG